LSFDQQSQAFFEVQFYDPVVRALFFQSLSHSLQAQGSEFFQSLMVKHEV
jgi:hypothetical protein